MRDEQNTHRARRLRGAANVPELRAWKALRHLREEGWPVRRQHPVGKIIVDFAIVKARLAIEVDGAIHDRDFVAARDAERDATLKAAGWKVLRVPAKDAMSGQILFDVRRALGLTGAALRIPLPPAGEGQTERERGQGEGL